MPKTIITWQWEEAFQRYGFDDGNGWNGTDHVAEALGDLGYECEHLYGSHNHYILTLTKGGQVIENEGDEPKEFLPKRVVDFLDQRFNQDCTVEVS